MPLTEPMSTNYKHQQNDTRYCEPHFMTIGEGPHTSIWTRWKEGEKLEILLSKDGVDVLAF